MLVNISQHAPEGAGDVFGKYDLSVWPFNIISVVASEYQEMHPYSRDAKSEEHEERAPAIFPPAVLIFGLPTQKIC